MPAAVRRGAVEQRTKEPGRAARAGWGRWTSLLRLVTLRSIFPLSPPHVSRSFTDCLCPRESSGWQQPARALFVPSLVKKPPGDRVP